jgi:hypothetical protein
LGEEWEVTHETWLDTVGNLTVTGYNPELSNASFASKKVILQTSHVELSRHVTGAMTWDEQAIARRGEERADRSSGSGKASRHLYAKSLFAFRRQTGIMGRREAFTPVFSSSRETHP